MVNTVSEGKDWGRAPPVFIPIETAQIALDEADQPDLVVNFADAYQIGDAERLGRPFVVVNADEVPEALVLLREIERSGFGRWEARAHVWACAGACACAFRRRGHDGRAHGAGRTFDDAIGEFACEYARQNQRDYELFIEAPR